ncbi:hypothetical protein SteCoe_22841 [Stentor coeruleus]|uniref:Uncharacterized protein n=1 Tax=Stentor coeruleus TaxID=5963 RepID=A0A1R2BLA1_9CILI|nr:hypothetical protein SteCoe_22841 [Stentor coeruleus]
MNDDDFDEKVKICEFLNKRKEEKLKEKHLKFSNYIEENYNFFNYGISQTSLAILNSMLDSEFLPCDIRPLPLKLMLLQVCEETALNEFEIALWVLIIEKYIFPIGSLCLYADLLFSALCSKEYLNSNINFLLEKFIKKDKMFSCNYSYWCISNRNTFTCADICKRYSLAMKYKSQGINLNFYVDEILMNSLQYELKKPKKTRKQSEIIYTELPRLARFNSLEPVTELSRINSTESLQILPLGNRTSSSGFSMKCSSCSVCSQYLSLDL